MHKNNTPFYLALAVLVGLFLGSFLVVDSPLELFKKSTNEIKMKRLIDFIEQDYVDAVDTDRLLDGAITQILEDLDPHSVYIPKEKLQQISERMQGNFVGIGVQFRMIKDSLTVLQAIEDGPSYKAGIVSGDRILMANTDTIFGKNMSNSALLKVLKGTSKTTVNLQVYRKKSDSLFQVTVTRGNVAIKSVLVSYMLTTTVGYVKLTRFARSSYEEFIQELTRLQGLGMTQLVLDLRGNGGGFIDIANQISDEFLPKGKLMVFTKNNKGAIEEFFSTEKGVFEQGNLFVLMDENSASASEIVAGALQDNDKGTIVGRRSFGKGLVQQEIDLGDGSAVRLTTARYYTPTGRSIQKPYRNTDEKNQYNEDLSTRYTSGELFVKDSIKIIDSLRYTTPKGKIVYGGGGIIPDVFVAIDTTSYGSRIPFIRIQNFAFSYVDSNREKVESWTFDAFMTQFDNNDNIAKAFREDLIKNGVTHTVSAKTYYYLKLAIATELFGDEGFYKVNQAQDVMLQKVLALTE